MNSPAKLQVKHGVSRNLDAEAAIQELWPQIAQDELSGVIFFCSSKYDLEILGPLLKKTMPCPVVGCTTAGEIGAKGYIEDGLVATSISSAEMVLHPKLIAPLDGFGAPEVESLRGELSSALRLSTRLDSKNAFALLLIDGLSMREEIVAAALNAQMSNIPLVGGSAGDDLAFRETSVYFDGEFHSDAAVFTLFETTLPYRVLQTQHFQPTGERLVVTKADPPRRIVYEFNGGPAKEEYAYALGIEPEKMTSGSYSSHPLMLRLGDDYYVRSVQQINDDDSISFFCAIDNGLVLRVGNSTDLPSHLAKTLESLNEEVPNIKLMIGCDCILRRLEMKDKGINDDVNRVLAPFGFIGFSTYGEQYCGVHINQTLSAVAIGE